MFTAYIVVTVLAAAANLYAAASDFACVGWVLANMTRLGIPHSWLFWLGTLKVAGAIGLFLGIFFPWIGIAAAGGLILFFLGAIMTALRAHWYAHLPFPLLWLLLSISSLLLQLTSR